MRYELSIHTMRAYRRKGIPFLCPDCRGPAVELTDEERESFLRWWRDQYSPAELERLGRAVASLAPL